MKKVFYVLLGLAVLYFILALFGPSEIKVERQIVINQPVNLVKEKMSDFGYFHDHWSPWTEKDSAMVVTYKGNPGEIGHYYAWSGNEEVGKGEMEIISINADSIGMRLLFDEEGESQTYYILNEENNSTKVTWGLIMKISYFARTPMLFINMDKMLGADFEKGLSNLKRVLETTESLAHKFEIKENNWGEVQYFGRKETVSFDNLDKYFDDNFGLLALILEKNKIEATSPASGLFFSYDDINQSTTVSSAYRVSNCKQIKGWEIFTFPASKVISVTYKGDPANSGAAHNAISAFLKEKNLDYSMVIEEYLIGPDQVTKPSDCVTNVYYLLKPTVYE